MEKKKKTTRTGSLYYVPMIDGRTTSIESAAFFLTPSITDGLYPERSSIALHEGVKEINQPVSLQHETANVDMSV